MVFCPIVYQRVYGMSFASLGFAALRMSFATLRFASLHLLRCVSACSLDIISQHVLSPACIICYVRYVIYTHILICASSLLRWTRVHYVENIRRIASLCIASLVKIL